MVTASESESLKNLQ